MNKEEEVKLHETTMSPYQREDLVRILKRDFSFEILAKMNDTELHKTWATECGYRWKYK